MNRWTFLIIPSRCVFFRAPIIKIYVAFFISPSNKLISTVLLLNYSTLDYCLSSWSCRGSKTKRSVLWEILIITNHGDLNVNIPNFYCNRKQVAWFKAALGLSSSQHLKAFDHARSTMYDRHVTFFSSPLHSADSKLLIIQNNYLMPVIDLLRHFICWLTVAFEAQQPAIINDLTILVHCNC